MPTTAVLVEDCGSPLASTSLLRVGLARDMKDLVHCQRLRYLVFNCELGEGLASSDASGLDRDPFDLICDHLMVQDAATSQLVGTYRLQTGFRAKGKKVSFRQNGDRLRNLNSPCFRTQRGVRFIYPLE